MLDFGALLEDEYARTGNAILGCGFVCFHFCVIHSSISKDCFACFCFVYVLCLFLFLLRCAKAGTTLFNSLAFVAFV